MPARTLSSVVLTEALPSKACAECHLAEDKSVAGRGEDQFSSTHLVETEDSDLARLNQPRPALDPSGPSKAALRLDIVSLIVGTRRLETRPAVRPLEAVLTASGDLFIDVKTGSLLRCNDLLDEIPSDSIAADRKRSRSNPVVIDTRVKWPYIENQFDADAIRPGRKEERLGLFEISTGDVLQCWASPLGTNPAFLALSIEHGSATARRLERQSEASGFYKATSIMLGHCLHEFVVMQLDVHAAAVEELEHEVLRHDAEPAIGELLPRDPALFDQMAVATHLFTRRESLWLDFVHRLASPDGRKLIWLRRDLMLESTDYFRRQAPRATPTELADFPDLVVLPLRRFSVDWKVYRATEATLRADTVSHRPRSVAWSDDGEPREIDWSAQRVVQLRMSWRLREVRSSPISPTSSDAIQDRANVDYSSTRIEDVEGTVGLFSVEAMILDVGQSYAAWTPVVELTHGDIQLFEFGAGRFPLIAVTLKCGSASALHLHSTPPDPRIPCRPSTARSLKPLDAVADSPTKVVVCIDSNLPGSDPDFEALTRLDQLMDTLRRELGEDSVAMLSPEAAGALFRSLHDQAHTKSTYSVHKR